MYVVLTANNMNGLEAALITGETKGIGLASAKRFQREGAKVVITERAFTKEGKSNEYTCN